MFKIIFLLKLRFSFNLIIGCVTFIKLEIFLISGRYPCLRSWENDFDIPQEPRIIIWIEI